MAFALVGSVGTVVLGATGAAINPAFGTSETRAVNNLLILWVFGFAANTLPAAPAGWSTGPQIQGTSCSASIFYKVAAGADAAPTVAGVASVILAGQLAEFSGNATTSPLDKTGTAAGTTSPQLATASGADAQAGELVIYSSGGRFSTGPAGSFVSTLNNGATAHDTTNAGASNNHYCFGYGITTGNSAADNDSLAFSTTGIVGAAVAIASFLLPAAATPTKQLMLMGVG